MKEKPILFPNPMVKAILDGRKTQTRRIIKPQPLFKTPRKFVFADETCPKKWEDCEYFEGTAPYRPGDIMWVRETWADIPDTAPGNLHYKASATEADLVWFEENGWKWRPSIHMPRAAARVFLEIKAVRVERVQDISVEDCICEGVSECLMPTCIIDMNRNGYRAINSYSQLWDEIYARRGYGWESNPWVWVYEFERVE